MSKLKQPIAIYYEHPHWFVPLFKELDRRGVPYVRIDAAQHHFNPAQLNGEGGYSLVFNRMSPSAYRRGHGQAIFYTLYYLDHLEQRGKRIVNGQKAFRYETSKALQLSLLETLGLPYPKSRVINNPADAVEASRGLRFPIVVKPNIGGSGAGVTKFNSRAELDAAAKAGTLDLGLDTTALVQEFIPARGGHIVRVEVVGGKFLYGIKVHLTGETFDLCPADICKTTGGQDLARAACWPLLARCQLLLIHTRQAGPTAQAAASAILDRLILDRRGRAAAGAVCRELRAGVLDHVANLHSRRADQDKSGIGHLLAASTGATIRSGKSI